MYTTGQRKCLLSNYITVALTFFIVGDNILKLNWYLILKIIRCRNIITLYHTLPEKIDHMTGHLDVSSNHV